MTTHRHAFENGLRWTLHASCPADWRFSLSRFSGNFFHTSRGLALTAPRGELAYLELADGHEQVGVAAGVRYRGAEDTTPRHVYFATVPALSCRRRRDAAVAGLLDTLAGDGIAEVVLDSLDASWVPGAVISPRETRHRREYAVDLEPSLQNMLARCAPSHRRRIDQYQSAGWRVRRLVEREAQTALAALEVAESHSGRHGDAFADAPAALAGVATSRISEDTGSAVYAAFDGELPVAAAIVGWADHRVYHVHGGCMSGGEPSDAELWLQWRVMREFAVAGFVSYNLGGLPAGAVDPAHQLSAIHRIRMGFGPRVNECLSVRWTLSRAPVAMAAAAASAGTPWRATPSEPWQH